MADNTSQMIVLLGAMRKQMNGAVADAMYYYGENYGLNYGVSLPTVRQIARQVTPDHSLAIYLYKQQVRELRLAALHIAQPEAITMQEIEFWAGGIINSEVAEEMAFTLLPRIECFAEIFKTWSNGDNEFLAYAALMAAARSSMVGHEEIILGLPAMVKHFPSSRIIAQGAVALLAATFDIKPEMKECITSILSEMGDSPSANYINEEMSWRMEF